MVRTPEIERLLGVTLALADVLESVLFVGGSVVGLFWPFGDGPKLLAYEDRGKGEIMVSHDLEDLLAVLSSRPEIVDEIENAPAECREIVLSRLASFRSYPDYEIAVEGHLANDAPDQAAVILARIDAVLAKG